MTPEMVATFRRKRESMGLSQMKLATRGKFALRSLQEWEQGRFKPHPKNFLKWARALGYKASEKGDS